MKRLRELFIAQGYANIAALSDAEFERLLPELMLDFVEDWIKELEGYRGEEKDETAL